MSLSCPEVGRAGPVPSGALASFAVCLGDSAAGLRPLRRRGGLGAVTRREGSWYRYSSSQKNGPVGHSVSQCSAAENPVGMVGGWGGRGRRT